MGWLFVQTFSRFREYSLPWFLGSTFVVIVVTTLISGILMSSFCREAAGSGIPQLKLAFWKDFGFVSFRAVWVKFIAGALAIGGGSSLGREGPSVHIGGGLASNLAGLLGEPKQRRRRAAAAGAAAGLAAAFNSPLASVTFVLEEILEDLNSRFLGSVLLAAVLGALVVHGMIGPQPAFQLDTIGSPGWAVYALIPIVSALAALAGAAFQSLTLELRNRQKRMTVVPAWFRPVLGAIAVWLLGVAVYVPTGSLGVFGLGYDDLTAGLNNHLEWRLAGVLLIAKLLATILAYGFGGCGGIFSPTLFFGGMAGIFVGGLSAKGLHLSPGDQQTLAVVGMSACLGAVVRAPVTGILIVFEMTHEFSLVPALMLGALVSQAIGRQMFKENFYNQLLDQDGHHLETVIPPRDLQSWQQLPVSSITNFQPVVVTDLSADNLKRLLSDHPYSRFPVANGEALAGVLTRAEVTAALAEKRAAKLETAITCRPSDSISALQTKLIDSSTFMVVVVAAAQGRVLGVVTLHDLLRAEVAMARSSNE